MLATQQALFILQSYNAFADYNMSCSAEQSILGKFHINEDAPSFDDLRALNVINTLKVLHDNNDPAATAEYAKQAELLLAYDVSGTKIATLEYVNEKQKEFIAAQKDYIEHLETRNGAYIKCLETQNEYLEKENKIANNWADCLLVGIMTAMFVCGSAYGLLQPKANGGFCEMTKTCQIKN